MNRITVFSKPWKSLSIQSLTDLMLDLEVDGVELTVREGYQVTPDNVTTELPRTHEVMTGNGLSISSIAAPITEPVIRAMGEIGVPILRVCVEVDMKVGYMRSVQRFADEVLRLEKPLRDAGVSIGVQNHCGFSVGSALGIMHLLDLLPEDIACAVLDLAHCALDGEPSEMAIDIVLPRIGLVNFKNAFRFRTNGPDEDEATWRVLWSTARHGGYSWSDSVDELLRVGYKGDICLPAEYGRSDLDGQLMGDEVIPRLRQDVRYLRSLLERAVPEEGGMRSPPGDREDVGRS